MELMDYFDHLLRYSEVGEHLPKKRAVGRVAYLLQIDEHRNSGTRVFLPNSCNLCTANVIFVVERCGRNPYYSSGSNPIVSQEALSLVESVLRRTLPASATSEMPR